MSAKVEITDEIDEQFRQAISEFKEVVREGKSRLFH